MKKSYLLILVAVLILVGGAYALVKNGDDKVTNNTNTTANTTPSTQPEGNTTEESTEQPAEENDSTEATITYSDDGFTPSNLTVQAGDVVTIKNDSSDAMEFNSAVHPTHTENTELNIGEVAAGASKTFTVNKVGTWNYHNHLNPNDTGTLVVE